MSKFGRIERIRVEVFRFGWKPVAILLTMLAGGISAIVQGKVLLGLGFIAAFVVIVLLARWFFEKEAREAGLSLGLDDEGGAASVEEPMPKVIVGSADIAETADALTGLLRRHLRSLGDLINVTSDEARNYWVHFALFRGEDTPFFRKGPIVFTREGPIVLNCEAVADEYLEPVNRLGESGTARLTALGWHPPDPNWWQEFAEVDFKRAAMLAAQTLSDVYGYRGGPLILERRKL